MPLYTGTFNWYGETITLHTKAKGEEQAFMRFCFKMVKIVGYSAYYIYNYFKQVSRDGYLIEEVRR